MVLNDFYHTRDFWHADRLAFINSECEEIDPYDYMTDEEAGEIGVMGYHTSEDAGLLEVQLNI